MSGRGGAGADPMIGAVAVGAPATTLALPLTDTVRVEPPGGDARTSWAYLALGAVVAALATMAPTEGPPGEELLVLVGVTSVVAMLFASERLRNHPAPSWMTTQRDPFLLFAGALAALVVPHLPSLIDGITMLERHAWLAACVGGGLAVGGFLVMIRDQTPARALDALYLAAITALAVGLVSWVAVLRMFDAHVVTAGQALQLLAPAVLDVLVIGIGLQAVRLRDAARHGCLLLVLAWTVLLAADVARLMAVVTDGTTADEALVGALMLGFALVGAAALHPHSTQAVDRVLDPIRRMPRSQVGVLLAAVLLGPAIVGLRLHESGTRSLVLALSGALSILVVVHLVRLVQGRAALEHRAHHDELTGLANRTLFTDRVAVAIAHARRAGTHSAVLFLDLDRFKTVNDSLGHSVGNLLLQAVAKRLRGATRAEDTVARLGGDEFVVFLPQVAHPEEAATVAANILQEFEEPFALSGHRLFASPSIGIAVFPQDGEDADALLKNADTAMYRAKARGRRTFCAYDRSMNDHAHERLALESRMHTAIEHGELRLHYQPKIHIASGQMTGMEALLRWEHPELGLLEPAEFISLAEDSGLIVPLGEWALHEACRQTQAWADAGLPPLVVAVNLSLRQFQQQQIEDVTARILRATRLDPALLELEVTESLATQDTEAVRATLLDLREMGVRCSIDDFGTGYSGLSHLMRFPIDKLKIDKSFVATIDGDREAPIVVAVVALAHGLGLEVVAEGVETAEQLERLRELGCDEMQGYLFSRPLPPERFEALLRGLPAAGGRLVLPQPGWLRVVPAVG